jgi:hypothetical protein
LLWVIEYNIKARGTVNLLAMDSDGEGSGSTPVLDLGNLRTRDAEATGHANEENVEIVHSLTEEEPNRSSADDNHNNQECTSRVNTKGRMESSANECSGGFLVQGYHYKFLRTTVH